MNKNYLIKPKILIVDDEPAIHFSLKHTFRQDYDFLSAHSAEEFRILLRNQRFDVILLDLHISFPEEGLQLLEQIKEADPDSEVIIFSSESTLAMAMKAIQRGASQYLLKEHSLDQLKIVIEAVLKKKQLVCENQHFLQNRKRDLIQNQIIGNSAAIQKLKADIEKVRKSKANVIIFAEMGCGKELVARHIGQNGNQPFVTVDSATITSTMAESILFGHEKGAFTGAVQRSKGLFEEANGGSIYFDEVSNMPLEIQAKLLRVIQEKEVTRLGSSKAIPLDFRVLCATNKDLEILSSQGLFKEDLYQRLNVIPLSIPPLRERKSDLPLLIEHFFKKYKLPGSPQAMSEQAMEVLQRYSWPGNVRELSNLIANLCTMVVDQERVEKEDLPERLHLNQGYTSRTTQEGLAMQLPFEELMRKAEDSGFYDCMQSIEGKMLSQLYQRYEKNIAKMSRSLRMNRSYLYTKLNYHNILQ